MSQHPETLERMVLLVEIYTISEKIFRFTAEFPMVLPLWRDTLKQFTEETAGEYHGGAGASPDSKVGRQNSLRAGTL